MRKILYVLSLLILIISASSIFSQYYGWFTSSMGGYDGSSLEIPIYNMLLVYQLNITQSTNLTSITFTVPEQVLQQQLYYCKTYDPFITNNISILQCEFAYPMSAILYNQYRLIVLTYPYFISSYNPILPISYDNITGLPQTFEINASSLSPGIYYLYVFYSLPYFYSFVTLTNLSVPSCPTNFTNVTSSDFDGGWCGANYGPSTLGYCYPWITGMYTNANGGYILSRYFFIKFDPLYPIFVGYPIVSCLYGACSDQGSITVMNPSTGQTKTITFFGGTLYNLQTLEEQYGLDPNQWNEIVSVTISSISPGGTAIPGFYLIYIPQNYSSIDIANFAYPEIYQIDVNVQITNYTVTITNNTKTVNAVIIANGSVMVYLLIYPYLIDQNNTIPNIPNYVPSDIIVNGVDYGSKNFINLQFFPTQSTYNIQITDNYPQYKTAIAIFTWNPNQNFVYVYGITPPIGTYNYSIGTPTLTSYTGSVRFLYAIPIYIFPHNTVSNAVFPILINNQYLQQTYGINISSNNFIIMQYNPGLNTYQLLPYFFDNQYYQKYKSPLIFVKIPQVTSMVPVILYLFITNSTYSDFSQPSSVFNYFVNLQESGYYSLLNIYTNGSVMYQQTPLGLQVNLYGGQLGFYIS